MSSLRTAALGALVVVLVAYGAVAARLWELPSGIDVAVQSLVVFPAFASAIWLALPLARGPKAALLAATAVFGGAALVCALLGLGSVSNVAKLAGFAFLGFWFLSLFEELWWVAAVSLVIPWVDVWSVAAGPTRYVVKERPGLFEHVSIAFPNPGETATVNIGPPDVIFFALFLAAAEHFRLRVAWTWVAMTGFLALTLALVWKFEASGLPALPAICLGFLLPNADLVWRNLREARATSRGPSEPSSG